MIRYYCFEIIENTFSRIGDTFCGGLGHEREVKLVNEFNKAMKTQPEVFSNVNPLPPNNFIAVLRFQHIESDLECDLNFKSGMSTTNSKLVKYVFRK